MCILNPLKFQLDVNSGVLTEAFGDTSAIFNTRNSFFELSDFCRNQILVKKESSGGFTFHNLIYKRDSTYYANAGYMPRLINFTGEIIQYNANEIVENLFFSHDGEIFDSFIDMNGYQQQPDNCPDTKGGGSVSFWDKVKAFFRSGGGGAYGNNYPSNGNGTSNGSSTTYVNFFNSRNGITFGWYQNPGNSGGGGTVNNPSCESPEFFSNIDFLAKKAYIEGVSQLLDQHNVVACNDPFKPGNEDCTMTYQEILCAADDINCFSGQSTNASDYVDCLYDYISSATEENPPANDMTCSDYAIDFINDYNLDLTPIQLAIMCGGSFEGSCTSQSGFGEFVKTELINNFLNDHPGFNIPDQNWLKNNFEFFFDMNDFILSKNNHEDAVSYSEEILRLKTLDNLIIWDRAEELYNLVETNPNALIADCISQSPSIDLNDYSELFNFEIPQSCQNKLDNLMGFSNQPITDGNVALTNVDIYEVEITSLPDLDKDGSTDTMDEVWEKIRLQFGFLASGSRSGFQPQCNGPISSTDINWNFKPYNSSEEILWLQTNPLTTIFKIEVSATGLADLMSDRGAIMASQLSDCCFIGSTINTPFSGSQPFSGNRQWGYRTNSNGDMVVYTKAVDVAHIRNITKLGEMINGPEDCGVRTYYDIAYETWTNLQSKVIDFIVDHGGAATYGKTHAEVIDYELIYEKLKQTNPIISITCE